jgi:hypothetical protein
MSGAFKTFLPTESVKEAQKTDLRGEANEDVRMVRSTGLEPVTPTVSRFASRGAKAQAYLFHFQ